MQSAATLLMVKPSCFSFNDETAASNAFQQQFKDLTPTLICERAIAEFEAFVNKLTAHGISVMVIDDTLSPPKPDAVFPNNWVSFHNSGQVFLYPMFAANRRLERRADILEAIGKKFIIKAITDLSIYEKEKLFLEGTGSMLFDRANKIIYACISPRTDKQLLHLFAGLVDYKTVLFSATDSQAKEIYHTNVMLCIGENFAVLCADAIKNQHEKEMVIRSLEISNHELITITLSQMNNFAGNMLQVRNNKDERFLILSEKAHQSLTNKQIKQLEQYSQLLTVSIPTIETIGGGSARCMMAEIFLPAHVK